MKCQKKMSKSITMMFIASNPKKERVLGSDWRKLMKKIEIDEKEYRVLERMSDTKYLVMSMDFIDARIFQEYTSPFSTRDDGNILNAYNGSDIDKFLEGMYQKMPQNIKNAIVPVEIQQDAYVKDGTTVKRNREIPAYRKVSSSDNVVRHIFLPSIEEIGNAIDLDDEDAVLDFLHEAGDSLRHKDIWTRDRLLFGEESWNTNTAVMTIMQHFCSVFFDDAQMIHGVRPAFVVDVSKLNEEVC